MELNGSIKALIGAVLVLIACLAAVSVVCDDSDASDTTYVVTLKANGGTASAGSNEKSYSIISGQPFTAPSNTYTKSGYILMGWSESSSGSVKLYPGQSMTISSNKTLYAVWQDLTYDGLTKFNGSSDSDMTEADIVQTTVGGSPNLNFADDGPYVWMKNISSTSFKYGLSVTHDGKTLSSVATSKNTSISADWATLEITKNGELSISGGPTREGVYTVEVTLKTKDWRGVGDYGDLDNVMLRWYVVVPVSADEQPVLFFSMNGGTGSVNKVQGPAGTATVLPNVTDSSGNQITKDGWTLVGWEIPDGKGSKSVYALGSLYTLSFTTTATAKWIQDPDVLVYSLDGGSLSNVQAYVVYDGNNITLRSTGVTKDGYTFIGWRESYNDMLAYAPGLEITVSGSMYMEAYFVPNGTKLYTVTFDTNGGQGPADLDTQKVEPGKSVFLPKVGFVRDGYEFVGWSTERDGEVISPSVVIDSDTTLYAIWQENIEPGPGPEPVTKYIVTFRVNQGAESYAPQEVRSGGYATEPKEPTRDGYVFLGWKSLTDTDMWDFMRDTVTNDTTLEAQWEQHFTIEYSETKVTVTICQAYYDMAADIYWGDPNDSSGVIGASVGTAEFDYAQKWSGEITVISHDASSDYKSKMHFEVADGPYVPIPDEWTVTFDPGNGSFPGKSAGETIEKKVLRGNAVSPPDEDPSWDDHEFSGWFYEGSEWNFERKVTRNMTLVAAWDNGKPEGGGEGVLTPKAVISIKKTEDGWKLDGSESVNAVSYAWTLDGEKISDEQSVSVQKKGLEYGEHKVSLTVKSMTGDSHTAYATLNYPDSSTDPSPEPPDTDGGESWLDRNLWMVVAVILIVIALAVVRFWL